MKPWLIAVLAAVAGIAIGSFFLGKPRYPTCDPKAEVCPACTKCTHCRICSKEGGSCSACRGRPKPERLTKDKKRGDIEK